MRDNEWTESCKTVGESCGTGEEAEYMICVNRYDEIDEAGETFVTGKDCVHFDRDLVLECNSGMEF